MRVTRSVGVDWAGGNWLAVVYEDDRYDRASVETEVGDVWEHYGDDETRIAIDVPIGLLSDDDGREAGEELARRCDELARAAVGSDRSPAVFNAPAREAMELKRDDDGGHGAVSDRNREITGKGLSIQAFSIVEAIGTVDEFLRGDDAPTYDPDSSAVGPFVESHPEVCFRAFAGEQLKHSKTSAAGVGERLEALERASTYPDGAASTFGQICGDLGDSDVTPDDVLDAMALGATANSDNLGRLPDDPYDHEGDLPRQIVYCTGEKPNFTTD